jgi:hypothetical protein
MGAKSCPFCKRTAVLTNEHLWSAWIGRGLGKTRYAFRQRDANGNIVRQKIRPGLDMKKRAVCAECNNGWMSQLENKVKPILSDAISTGNKTSFDEPQLRTIAQFAFKNAVVADYTAEGRNPFFTTSARRMFAEGLTIPDGVQVWLATFRDPLGHSGFFLSNYNMLKGRSNPRNGFELYVFTFSAGFLVMQVTASRWINPLIMSRYDAPVVWQDPLMKDFATEIWPLDRTPVAWPPPKAFESQGDIYLFNQRWKKISVSFEASDLVGL